MPKLILSFFLVLLVSGCQSDKKGELKNNVEPTGNLKIADVKQEVEGKENEKQGNQGSLSIKREGFISDSDISSAYKDRSQLQQQARGVPFFKSGKSVGIRIFAMRAGSIYEKFGLGNGDVLLQINDTSLADVLKLGDVISLIKDNSESVLMLERDRKPCSIHYSRSEEGIKYKTECK